MRGKPKSIDEYLAAVSDEQRAALERIRKTVRAAAPGAEECISYGLPAFRLDGKGARRLRRGREPLLLLSR